jgi:hypothetical protein
MRDKKQILIDFVLYRNLVTKLAEDKRALSEIEGSEWRTDEDDAKARSLRVEICEAGEKLRTLIGDPIERGRIRTRLRNNNIHVQYDAPACELRMIQTFADIPFDEINERLML